MTLPNLVAKRIISYLTLTVDPSQIDRILWKYSKENREADMTGLHFNRARIGRYKEELSSDQCQRINEVLGLQISRMGYN